MRPPLVLFHKGCHDGFTAAWVAKLKMPNAECLPWNYGDPPPLAAEVAGRDVYILDFSFLHYEIVLLDDACNHLEVLDHHKTAEAALKGLECCTFNMNHSGAMLAWLRFFPGKEPLRLVSYVEDRDLWRWDLQFSREISYWLRGFPMTFDDWREAATLLEDDYRQVIREGIACSRLVDTEVERACKNAYGKFFNGLEEAVPTCNAANFQSEITERLLEKNPSAPMAAVFYSDREFYNWSLRSRSGFDCSAIAKLYGGGGHAQAAGFRMRLSD
jgi:uncharacterized protein